MPMILTLIVDPVPDDKTTKHQTLQNTSKESNFRSKESSPGNQVVVANVDEVGEQDEDCSKK